MVRSFHCGNKIVPKSVLCLTGYCGRREGRLREQEKVDRFEEVVLPHLDAAYNLARWLTRNDADAQDIAQEAVLRAFKYFEGFHGGDSRAWLLTIVRNTCYTWLGQNRAHELTSTFDEEIHSVQSTNPETMLLESADRQMLKQAMEELPVEFREVIILRELEGLSYKEIAGIIQIPVGTVMSRLARARKRLELCLAAHKEI
jgi:RNA polymerase sigma-70 factor, ECF subfamily